MPRQTATIQSLSPNSIRLPYPFSVFGWHFTRAFGLFAPVFCAFSPAICESSEKITTFVIAKVGSDEKSFGVGYDLCHKLRYKRNKT